MAALGADALFGSSAVPRTGDTVLTGGPEVPPVAAAQSPRVARTFVAAVVFTHQLDAAVHSHERDTADTAVTGTLDGIDSTLVVVANFVGVHDVEVAETLVVEGAPTGHA